MRCLVAGVFVLLLSSPAWAQRELREYTSEKGGYRVKMPGRPKVETKDLDTGPGSKPVPVTTAKVEGSTVVYAVSHAVYPESYGDVPARKILDGVRDGLKGTDGKLDEDEKEITISAGSEKAPGRELVIRAGKNYIRARVYLAGNRLYQVMVTGSKDAVHSNAADDFLYSFQLIK